MNPTNTILTYILIIYGVFFLSASAAAETTQKETLPIVPETATTAVNTSSLQNMDVFYKDGINFSYDPVHFALKFKFRMQNRYSFEDNDSDSTSPDKSEFVNRRMRLRLEGTVLDPKLTYKLQFSFTRQDMDWDNSAFPNILRDANIGYQLTDNDQVIFGLAKLPGNRQRVISSGRLEFVDRSIANALLNIDRDVGLQWHHRFGETRPLWLKLAFTNGQGRGSAQNDNGMNFTSRMEWLPLGRFKNDGDYFEGDLVYEETPKLSFAAGYSRNSNASRTRGQLGPDIEDGVGRDIGTFISDALIKYRGWSWSAEYFRRSVDRPEVDATQNLFDGQGWNTQLSYTWRSMYTTGARWAQTLPDENIRNLFQSTALPMQKEDQYSIMFGKYFNNHTVKLQADVNYQPTYTYSNNITQDNWVYRLQLELGI